MKIGLIPANPMFPAAEFIIGFARQAAQAGVESLWTFEQVMVPENYQSNPVDGLARLHDEVISKVA
jgi:hypothetical protein